MPPLSPITHDESQLLRLENRILSNRNIIANAIYRSARYRVVFVLTFAWKRSGAEQLRMNQQEETRSLSLCSIGGVGT